MSRINPSAGDKLYLYRPCNSWYVEACRDPYTVESVKGNTCIVREARLVFYGTRYFNTLPDEIVDDPDGSRITLRWNEKKQRWQESPAGSYPRVAVFGAWAYFPYLD